MRDRIDNPHCDYLKIMIQFGIAGLIAWLAWMGTLWYYSSRIAWPWSLLGRCTAAMIAISNLSFSHMSNSRTGCFYALMLALFLGGARAAEKEPRKT